MKRGFLFFLGVVAVGIVLLSSGVLGAQSVSVPTNVSVIGYPDVQSISPVHGRAYTSIIINLIATVSFMGTWCSYSLDGADNVTMLMVNNTHFTWDIGNLSYSSHSIIYTCNNTYGYKRSIQVNFSVAEAYVPPPGGGGGGGGGGASGGGGIGGPTKPVHVIESYYFDKQRIDVSLVLGNSTTTVIRVVNNGTKPLHFNLGLNSLQSYITLPFNEFVLSPGETKVIEIDVRSPPTPGVFTTALVVEVNKKKLEIPFVLQVVLPDNLFDIRLQILDGYTLLNPGDVLLASVIVDPKDYFALIKIENITGLAQETNITLYYFIKDLNDTVVLSDIDTDTIGARKSIQKQIVIPEYLPGGKYVFVVEVDYLNRTASAYASFTIRSREVPFSLWRYGILPYIILAVLLLLIVIYLLHSKISHEGGWRKHFLFFAKKKRESKHEKNTRDKLTAILPAMIVED